jgi:hypothetical protein
MKYEQIANEVRKEAGIYTKQPRRSCARFKGS